MRITSIWHDFHLLFLAGVVSLIVPAIISLFARISLNRFPPMGKATPTDDFFSSHPKVNTRFFLAINSTLALIVLGLLLAPCVAMFRPMVSGGDRAMVLRGGVVIVGICGLLMGSLLYSSRKGDLSGVSSQKEAPDA